MFQKVGGRVKLVKYAKVLTSSYFPISFKLGYIRVFLYLLKIIYIVWAFSFTTLVGFKFPRVIRGRKLDATRFLADLYLADIHSVMVRIWMFRYS